LLGDDNMEIGDAAVAQAAHVFGFLVTSIPSRFSLIFVV
jgi:hypothetical protein